MDDGTEVAGNTFDGTGSYALQLSSIQASVVGSLSVHDNVFRDILVVDSDAGTVDIHDNVFNVPGGSLLGLYARGCHNGGCSTQSIHDNQFYEVRWDAMVAQGRGSIVQNTFHVVPQGTGGATWGPQHVVELAAPYQMAPSSTLFSITGNDFDIGNLDIFCDAPGMMTQSGNTVRDGSLDVGGC
jgi:hypothetical protein